MVILDNQRVAAYFPPHYYAAMSGDSLRDRIIAAMKAQKVSKAGLSRASGVPYHALDKYLKGVSQTTSLENGQALANALGIGLPGEASYEELRRLFFALPEEKRRFAVDAIRGLVQSEKT